MRSGGVLGVERNYSERKKRSRGNTTNNQYPIGSK